MSQMKLASGRDFYEALANYNSPLATHNLGVIESASYGNKGGTGTSIFVTIIGIIFGAFTGFGFYRTSRDDTGSAVLADEGIHYFSTSTEKVKEDGVKVKKHVINSHGFFYYSQMNKAIRTSSIFSKRLNLSGTVPDIQGRNIGYRLSIPLSGNGEQIDVIKSKLEEQYVRVRKSRASAISLVVLLACVAAIFFMFSFPRLTNRYLEMDYSNFRHEINNPTGGNSGRYQMRTTSLDARISSDVFTIDFGDGPRNFVSAVIAGNERTFLLELDPVPMPTEVGDIARVTAIGEGVIATRPQPEESATDRFFNTVGVFFGDPSISGVVAEVSDPNMLSGTYYLHMRAIEIEPLVIPVLGETDTYVSDSGNYTITFVDAFFTTSGVGQREHTTIVIFFDYEALEAHRASRPFNRVAVYQGNTPLDSSDGGIRASDADDRGFMSTQNVEAGEVFRAMASVVPINDTDPIRLVIYGTGFDALFMYEMAVR